MHGGPHPNGEHITLCEDDPPTEKCCKGNPSKKSVSFDRIESREENG